MFFIIFIFLRKKKLICLRFSSFHGQHLVTAALATPSFFPPPYFTFDPLRGNSHFVIFIFVRKILQGLRVGQAAVTERWPEKVLKTLKISFFFRKKIKITTNTPGTARGPGGRDRTLAVKSRSRVKCPKLSKNDIKIHFCAQI